jgi:hypothetical protein
MKATLLALVALAAGCGIGFFLTQQEFAHDVLPVDPVSAGSSASSAKAKIGPKATVVNTERHDFGTMDRSEHRTHDFLVRNDGDATLTLTTGQPSCGVCVKVFRVDKSQVEPGGTATVRIEWEAKPGEVEFEQSGPLNTNDPLRPTIQLTIRGRVIDTVRADRGEVNFADISTNQSSTATVNIYGFRSPELKVEKFDLTAADIAPYFNVTFAPLAAEELAKEKDAKAGLKMSIEVKPGLPIGQFRQIIVVTTNQDAQTAQSINVTGNVASDILLAGPRVDSAEMLVGLGTVQRNTAAKHTVYLRVKGPHRDQTQIRIASVEPVTEFSATLGEPNRENPKVVLYPLTIEVPAGARPVNHMFEGAYAKVHLATTHPDVKELTINVRYMVRE